LTPEQIQAVQTSWAPFQSDPQQTGSALFSGFLAANSDIQAQFPKFATVPAADLPNNEAFQAHALKIYNIINNAVLNQNWEAVEQLSSFHKDIQQTNKSYFNRFRAYFVNYLNVNEELTGYWNQALDRFFNALFKNF
jgi:hypothetical protein